MDEVMTVGDAASSSIKTSPGPFLASNLPLLSAFLAGAIAQFLKLFTTWYKERKWESKRMLDSGGMPSSHSATVSALAVAIAFQEGSGGPAFAIALVFACVVMYDATGVRLHAGRQAELLNQIVCEFPPEHPLSSIRPLRDSLGHTPLQGIFCSGLAYYIQGLVMKDKGPVFVTAFSPLSMVIVAIMSSFILGERLYFGRVLGAVVIIVGLYLVVWGKNKDENCSSSEDLKLPTKQILEDNKTMETLTIEPNSCIDLKNNNEQK